MNDSISETKPRAARAFLLAAASLVLFAAAIWFALPRAMPNTRVTITVGTNGVPRIFGCSLANKTVRRGAFLALGHFQTYVIVVAPHGGLAATNALEVEQEMAVASLAGAIHGHIK